MIMRTNALSCILFGLVFLIATEEVIVFLSTNNQMPILILQSLAIVLIINGLNLIYEARKVKPLKLWVLYFSMGDFIWVLASILLLMNEMWITTKNGIIITITISIMVGIFGLLQLSKIRESNAQNIID